MGAGKRRLFVDTSGWIEVFGKNNPFHEKAKKILIQAMKERRPIITTNYVITEFVGRGGKACFNSPSMSGFCLGVHRKIV